LLDGNGPYFNGEIGVTPTDTCADIQQSQTNIYDLNPSGGGSISILCQDHDGNGILDVGACLSWDNNNNHACNSAADTIPGTSSKCRCAFVDVGKIAVCGDGKVDPTAGEECDEGTANGSSMSCCSATCTLVPAGPPAPAAIRRGMRGPPAARRQVLATWRRRARARAPPVRRMASCPRAPSAAPRGANATPRRTVPGTVPPARPTPRSPQGRH